MSISRNATYNILGNLVPSVMILLTVPLYLGVVGLERYGVLNLCLVLIGYTTLVDHGFSLTMIRKIAEAKDQEGEAARLFWTFLYLAIGIGAVGSVLMYFGARWYFATLTDQAPHLRDEFAAATWVLAAMAPIFTIGGVISGALAARERFLILNAGAAFSNTMTAVLPLAVAYFWTLHLGVLVAALVAGRLIVLPWLILVCRRVVPVRKVMRPALSRIRDLLQFSGWITLTLLVNGVIQTLDRLVIGARLGPAVVPLYVIPYGVVSRVVIIPQSLSSALFPRLAHVEADEQARLMSQAFKAVAVIVTPAMIGIILIADPFFRIWMGPELAVDAAPIAYVLAGSFWMSCFGQLAFSSLQATGRPSIVAKVFVAELVLFSGLLVVALSAFGLMGAAAAFAIRATGECLTFLWIARKLIRNLSWLLVPAALVAASIAAALSLSSPTVYLVNLVMLAAACLWSLLNVPDTVKRFFPFGRQGSTAPSASQPDTLP